MGEDPVNLNAMSTPERRKNTILIQAKPMKATQRFQLIDGTFTASEGRQLLLALVQSKIDFHDRERLSSQERFGTDPTHSQRRLVELRKLHETLRGFCQEAGENEDRIRVNGWIEITAVAPSGDPMPQA